MGPGDGIGGAAGAGESVVGDADSGGTGGDAGSDEVCLRCRMNGDNAGDRVILNSAGVKGTGSGVTALTNTAGDTVGYLADNPSAQYVVAGPGALATSGKANFTTPIINNWDFSIAKHINITERCRLDFSAGFFNLFNHPQFTTGSVNQATSVSATDQRNYLIPSKSTFNQPRATWGSNPRQVALGVKFSF